MITGTTTTRAAAVGHALAAALELYDRRTLITPGTRLRVEVVLDHDVAAWVSGGPHGATRAGRGEYLLSLAMLHGTLLGHARVTELPPLPAAATRVDLDPDPNRTGRCPTRSPRPAGSQPDPDPRHEPHEAPAPGWGTTRPAGGSGAGASPLEGEHVVTISTANTSVGNTLYRAAQHNGDGVTAHTGTAGSRQ